MKQKHCLKHLKLYVAQYDAYFYKQSVLKPLASINNSKARHCLRPLAILLKAIKFYWFQKQNEMVLKDKKMGFHRK